MIQFACPTCKTPFEAPNENSGKKFHCQNCGQRIEIPKPPIDKTVLGSLMDSFPATGSHNPILIENQNFNLEPNLITVHLVGRGIDLQKFKTSSSLAKIWDEAEQMIYSLGLKMEEGGYVKGTPSYPISPLFPFYKGFVSPFHRVSINGVLRGGKEDFFIDLSFQTSLSELGIFFAIFYGVITCGIGVSIIWIYGYGKKIHTKNMLEIAFRDLRTNLDKPKY